MLPSINLIAPSGWPDTTAALRGINYLQRYANVDGQAVIKRRYQRFAGNDQERAEDINQFVDSENIPDIIMAVRGGYGLQRILDLLDYANLKRRFQPKMPIIIGYSDFTALNLALLSQAGLTSFQGPMLAHDFGASPIDAFSMQHFWQTLRAPTHTCQWSSTYKGELDVQGMLWGGNLSILVSLLGTPYFPHVEKGILFVEDVGEPWFRVERMLEQLRHAGVLAHQQAVLLGSFEDAGADAYASDFNLATISTRLYEQTGAALVSGLPFGHGRQKITLPVGGMAHLHTLGNGHISITLSHYPWLESYAGRGLLVE